MFSKGNKSSSGDSRVEISTPTASTATAATPSIISADLKIVGNLASGGDLQIDGTVEGDITSRRVTIGEGALVQGAILADSVRIYGSVSGEIKANTVTLAKSARVDGDIGHQSIAMEAGASVTGRLTRLDKPVAGVGAVTSGKAAGTDSSSSDPTPTNGGGSGGSSGQSYGGYQA